MAPAFSKIAILGLAATATISSAFPAQAVRESPSPNTKDSSVTTQQAEKSQGVVAARGLVGWFKRGLEDINDDSSARGCSSSDQDENGKCKEKKHRRRKRTQVNAVDSATISSAIAAEPIPKDSDLGAINSGSTTHQLSKRQIIYCDIRHCFDGWDENTSSEDPGCSSSDQDENGKCKRKKLRRRQRAQVKSLASAIIPSDVPAEQLEKRQDHLGDFSSGVSPTQVDFSVTADANKDGQIDKRVVDDSSDDERDFSVIKSDRRRLRLRKRERDIAADSPSASSSENKNNTPPAMETEIEKRQSGDLGGMSPQALQKQIAPLKKKVQYLESLLRHKKEQLRALQPRQLPPLDSTTADPAINPTETAEQLRSDISKLEVQLSTAKSQLEALRSARKEQASDPRKAEEDAHFGEGKTLTPELPFQRSGSEQSAQGDTVIVGGGGNGTNTTTITTSASSATPTATIYPSSTSTVAPYGGSSSVTYPSSTWGLPYASPTPEDGWRPFVGHWDE